MATKRFRTIAFLSLSILMIVVAYVGGVQIGSLLNHKAEDTYLLRRDTHTAELLDQMATIAVGDTLPDHTFLTLDGEPCRLSEIINKPTLIVFFDYHCGNCLAELELLNKATDSVTQANNCLMISATNPLHLINLKKRLNIKCPILHDEEGRFVDAMHIYTYPFNVFSNSNLQIEEIIASGLVESDVRRVVATSRIHDTE